MKYLYNKDISVHINYPMSFMKKQATCVYPIKKEKEVFYSISFCSSLTDLGLYFLDRLLNKLRLKWVYQEIKKSYL